MSEHCCNKELINTDPCQAIEDGVLNRGNFPNSGLNQGQWLLLLAQCGATNALEEINDKMDIVISLLQDIDANTDELEAQLAAILVELQDVNVNLGDIITELQAILVAVQAIDDNTDEIEGQLATIITLLTSIDGNTDALEALITASNILLTSIDACCAANNALLTTIDSQLGTLITLLTAIDATLTAMAADLALLVAGQTAGNAILTDIEANQIDPFLFGTHVVATGTEATPPVAAPLVSWVVVRTGGAGNLIVDGIPLVNVGDSTAEEAQPQFQIPAPVIAIDVGVTYAWRTKA